jgi:transposase-like protein
VGKVTEDQKTLMIELYRSGDSTLQVARRLQISPTTVNHRLHCSGIALRGPRETSVKCRLRHDAFDELTTDSTYWIGFLFADGSVSGCGQSGRVQVRVSEHDSDHLVKLRTFLGSTHTIGAAPAGNYGGYQSRPSVRFSVRSDQLAQRLLSLGRYEGTINDSLTQSRDFWRGVVDGDGSLGFLATGYPYFGLVGSRRLLESFLFFLESNALAARMTIRPDKTIFQVATAGHTAEEIVSYLYRNAAVALDRKAASAAKIAAVKDARLAAECSRLAQIAEWYRGGASLKLIGSRLGVSDVTILRWMEKAEMPRRERYGGRQRTALG